MRQAAQLMADRTWRLGQIRRHPGRSTGAILHTPLPAVSRLVRPRSSRTPIFFQAVAHRVTAQMLVHNSPNMNTWAVHGFFVVRVYAHLLLGLAAAGISHQQTAVILQQGLLDLALALLIHVCKTTGGPTDNAGWGKGSLTVPPFANSSRLQQPWGHNTRSGDFWKCIVCHPTRPFGWWHSLQGRKQGMQKHNSQAWPTYKVMWTPRWAAMPGHAVIQVHKQLLHNWTFYLSNGGLKLILHSLHF